MTQGGDAAEQIVRLSLEGMEVAVKISGESAKNIAIILMAVLREEHKTKGKARLSSMIRSGKELKVFSVQNKDLEKFAREAKRYGVLYCVLKDKGNRSSGTADIIARAEDAAKIQRIVDRFGLATVDRASVTDDIEKSRKEPDAKSSVEDLINEVLGTPGKEQEGNPEMAEAEKSHPSLRNSEPIGRSEEASKKPEKKQSVRERLSDYQKKNRQKDPKERLAANVKKETKGKER